VNTDASSPASHNVAATVFERVGGLAFFERLAAEFYVGVRADPVLLALYPQPDDLTGAQRRLALFLAQYWGGPTDYSDERGHPRLRMRHAGFPIDETMRDRWLKHMNSALEVAVAAWCDDDVVRGASATELVGEMRDYFVRAADHLRNV
jgi:hemoglobin